MPTMKIRDAVLSYSMKGRGTPLVLLHAFPVDSRLWEGQVEALAGECCVVTIDFSGFGQSPAGGPFTMESLAEDVHELRAKLGLGSIVLGGLSMGGYVSLAYARKFPDTLRGLMLMDTKAEADSPEAREGRGKMIALAGEKGSVAVGEAMLPKLLSAEAIVHRPGIAKRLREMMAAATPIGIQQALAAMRDRPDQTEMLGSIKVPTMVIVGDADIPTPPGVAEAMQRKIPGAELVVIRGAGHLSAMEQPEQVNAAMKRLVATI